MLVVGFSGQPAFAATAPAATTPQDAVCDGVGLATGGSGCETPTGTATVNDTITTVINILSVLVGVVSVIMLIIGGLRYVISNGDPAKVNTAKDTILYAIIGLVIVASAQGIAQFTLNKVTQPPTQSTSGGQ